MNSIQISKSKKFALVIATLSLVLGGLSTASAANKTITCYKGTVVKKVTAKAPKCPTGYTTKKPVAKPTVSATAKPTTVATTPAVTAAPTVTAAAGGMMAGGGGISALGGYSDGGRLLKGPGDGVSDSIPATIGGKQPARLADGEFVIPARIVSEIGNGSTEAGAKKLYAMMDRIQGARKKSIKNVAANTKADKYLPK